MPTRITVATSIVPRNIEHQQSAIASWRALGFEVISVNSPAEIEAVQSDFPAVTFVAADRTAEAETGKPYIYFDDVRKALAATGADICGIINSDIHLLQRQDVKGFIEREAKNSFLFGSRIDVEERHGVDGEIYFVGFDVFFFDRAVIDCYPASDFCLGAPWWDYWAPAIPLARGIACKELVSPFAFHLKHETKWAPDLFYRFGERIAGELTAVSHSVALDKKLSAGIADVVANRDFNIFSFVVLQYILDVSEQISFDSAENSNKRVTIGKNQFASMRRQMIDRCRDCCHLSRENERLRASLEAEIAAVQHEKEVLNAFQSSLSWRLTAPLRRILDAVKGC